MSAEIPRSDRPAGFEDDVCFSETLVESIIGEFTQPGDVVLDPFAGFGTTLVVAERLGRRAVGIELLHDRVSFIRGRVSQDALVLNTDARGIGALKLDPVDLVLTSPPYMTIDNHPQNPLTGYQTDDGDYWRYLTELREVFAAAGSLLKPGGRVVVNAANIRGGRVTTLAWDLARELSTALRFIQDVVISWDVDQDWLTNDYLLIFAPR